MQTGQASQQAVLAGTRALIDAHLGREKETRAAAAEALRLADDTAAMFARLLAVSALGVLELSLGNAAAALEQSGAARRRPRGRRPAGARSRPVRA